MVPKGTSASENEHANFAILDYTAHTLSGGPGKQETKCVFIEWGDVQIGDGRPVTSIELQALPHSIPDTAENRTTRHEKCPHADTNGNRENSPKSNQEDW